MASSLADMASDELDRLLRGRLFPTGCGRLIVCYLFGSLAAQSGRPDSDVDLALLADQPLDAYDVFKAAQDLAVRLGKDVDLVDLATATTVLRAQVVSNGRRLLTGDPVAADEFEMYALSDYARLNEERREVLAAFDERYR